ncbi:MAG: N-6 DNA methylase [Deltaproteobacteria bacterium]|nr:N-6 DNA methylase [Deltaproteobacteria bacterium]
MTDDITQAREAIRRCRELREAGKVEAVLRGEFQSRLRLIFPDEDHQTWINHYSEGAEAGTRVGQADGAVANRFIDNLVGCTTIEYEPDLRITVRREHGFAQVREHVAGLVRSLVPVSQVRGILSDTVEWVAYDAELASDSDPAACTADDITLVPVDKLNLTTDDEPSATRLIGFVRKHLAREQSRPLKAEFITDDLGLESTSCERSKGPLRKLVDDGRATDPSIALATDLWSGFVDHLEGEKGTFRTAAYVDEVYLCILARLLGANVLAGHAISSDDAGLGSILDGSHFRDRYQLSNVVEQDYFGWLVNASHLGQLVPIARQIQQDLYAYDFSWRPETDLFGRLMAQLARRSQRKLLGQEWTPGWLGRHLALRCLDNLPEEEEPRIVDMCCGSGSILAEVLKAVKDRFGFTDIAVLHNVATGFDIDPLAVSLAKTTWVVTLADEIKAATSPIVIPIYHADSLFSVTPITPRLPDFGESETIPISLDGIKIDLPDALIQPECRELFDRIIDWAYDETLDAQANGCADHLTEQGTARFLDGAAAALGISLSAELKKTLVPAVFALVHRMAELALAGRNGIWAFILRNTYRPGLLAGRFNGLVSNPPWLAMSSLGDNPYREVLTGRAKLYGIRPPGQSFLHLELGTTHLLHAVDRYLAPDAAVACLIPGTLFNGHHHELFRRREFLTAARPIALDISEMWQVEHGTFKYPGAAVIGHKRASTDKLAETAIAGFLARWDGLEATEFSVRAIVNKRTAWVLEQEGVPVASSTATVMPQQGADLMPRTAVCIEIVNEAGVEYRVDTPSRGTLYGFTIKEAKELKDERFPGYVAPCFVYRMAQSANLLPFVLGEHCAPIAIPAVRDDHGAWRILDEAHIRGMGLTETARRFRTINDKLEQVGQGKKLQQRIDERMKLSKQVMPQDGYLILAGAGGKHICAACVQIAPNDNLVVDQTLYWRAVSGEVEAWFLVGMLNSYAMTEAITPFNPKGAFGERHIHALPYRLMPAFDPANEDHREVARLAQQIAELAGEIVAADAYLSDPNRALSTRRMRLRKRLQQLTPYRELEQLCAAALATTTFGQEEDDGGDE